MHLRPRIASLQRPGWSWARYARPRAALRPPAREEILRGTGRRRTSTAPRSAAPSDEQQRFVRSVDSIESAITRRPLVPATGDAARDGPVTHAAQLAAIAHARRHVHSDHLHPHRTTRSAGSTATR
jgi:hypothetical protein